MLSVYTKPSWEYIGMRIGFNNVSIQTSSQECRDEPKNEHFSALKFSTLLHSCSGASIRNFSKPRKLQVQRLFSGSFGQRWCEARVSSSARAAFRTEFADTQAWQRVWLRVHQEELWIVASLGELGWLHSAFGVNQGIHVAFVLAWFASVYQRW